MKHALVLSVSFAAIAAIPLSHAQSSSPPGWNDIFDNAQAITLQDLTGTAQTDSQFGFSLASSERALMIGAPRMLVNGDKAGAFFHLRARGNTLRITGSNKAWTQSSSTVAGTPEAGDRFGHALAAGRPYNNQQVCDDRISNSTDTTAYCWEYLVGAPGEDIGDTKNAGMVNIVGINASAPNRTLRQVHQGMPGISGRLEAYDNLGTALAVGDFDGSGTDDFAIGVHYEDGSEENNTGAVNVIFADQLRPKEKALDGWMALDDNLLAKSTSKARPGDRFGYALAAGDFNGDGADDLAVGAPRGQDPHPDKDTTPQRGGMVHVYLGRDDPLTDGFETRSSDKLSQSNTPGARPETWDLFGAALAAGDFNGDGIDDLAIGVPGEAIRDIDNAGMVHILYGTDGTNLDLLGYIPVVGNYIGPLTDSISNATSGAFKDTKVQTMHQGTKGMPGKNEAGDMFGAALGVGDVNNDGFDDLIIGSPGEDLKWNEQNVVDAGMATIVFGSIRGLQTMDEDGNTTAVALTERNLPGVMAARTGARFGFSIATGKFNDGLSIDLAIGNGSGVKPGRYHPFSNTPDATGHVVVYYND